MQFREKGNVFLPITLLVVIFISLFLYLIVRKSNNSGNINQNNIGTFFGEKQMNCESNKNPRFSSEFTDLSKIQHLAPIGGIMVGSPARSYIFLKEGAADTPIYAPTDAILEGIVYAKRMDPNNPNASIAKGEYRLDFRVSCEVTFHFDHIDTVNDEIKKLWKGEPIDNTREAQRINFKVKAGDLLGYTNGTDASRGFDFFLLNTSKVVSHVNPERWQWEQTTIADCPYDYFTEDLKTKYYNAFASQDGKKLIVQNCGSISHDVAGTASGGWFQENSKDTQGKWLEIGNINGKVEMTIRESGSYNFAIRDYQPAIMPEKLAVGNSTCYSGEGNWAHIKLLSDNKLAVVKGSGNCPADFSESMSELWER